MARRQATKPANVVDLTRNSLVNVPANLRSFADRIDAGEFGSVTRAATILETDREQKTFAWGHIHNIQMLIGVLQTAIVRMSMELFS